MALICASWAVGGMAGQPVVSQSVQRCRVSGRETIHGAGRHRRTVLKAKSRPRIARAQRCASPGRHLSGSRPEEVSDTSEVQEPPRGSGASLDLSGFTGRSEGAGLSEQ